ncbi:MAG TPA: class I SAM-dependent rRNA methyltransferase, partial [Spirochaetota bacterium]
DAPFSNDTLHHLIHQSVRRRKSPFIPDTTNVMRLVFSEGDYIPGLIVDSYDGHLVLQCLTLGIDKMKEPILSVLQEILNPKSIYERSDYPGRKLEGLPEMTGQCSGITPNEIVVSENEIRYPINVIEGQKTGFFIDQRDNRSLVGECAQGRKVLNMFSYSGGFTFAAIRGGARQTMSVDISSHALSLAKKTYSLNEFTTPSEFIEADVFEYLRNEPIDADLVILDPPAFAKRRDDVDNACRGYKEINLQLFKKVPPGTIVLTCSCSRFIGADLFQKVIFSAVADSGRKAQILRRTGHPVDHPVNIAVPETEYLKGLLLLVE